MQNRWTANLYLRIRKCSIISASVDFSYFHYRHWFFPEFIVLLIYTCFYLGIFSYLILVLPKYYITAYCLYYINEQVFCLTSQWHCAVNSIIMALKNNKKASIQERWIFTRDLFSCGKMAWTPRSLKTYSYCSRCYYFISRFCCCGCCCFCCCCYCYYCCCCCCCHSCYYCCCCLLMVMVRLMMLMKYNACWWWHLWGFSGLYFLRATAVVIPVARLVRRPP